VPSSLPAMIKASRIQDKARAVGFDWENSNQVFEKVLEELHELKHEIESNSSQQKKEEEFGDLLFSIINYSRFVNINPEDALEKTNKKFIKRFQYIEQKAKENNKELSSMSLAEMDALWNEAKKL
jgi:XTP/dITP diphosphohydrolase